MSASGTAQGKATRKVYNSGSLAASFTDPATMPDWAHVIGAGTTVLVDEAGNSVPIVTDAAEPAACIPGPWSAFTSTTATRVRMGNGRMPQVVVPASAVPATTAAVGGTTMSVAPAVAATPIAVGNNDPRVCTVETPIYLAAADGVFVESTVWIPGVVGTITGATLSANADIAQSNTNYLTFALAIRDGAGGASAPVASMVSKASGASFLAFRAVSLGAITNPTTTATSQITFASTKSAAGQASTGPALLRITYTVP